MLLIQERVHRENCRRNLSKHDTDFFMDILSNLYKNQRKTDMIYG